MASRDQECGLCLTNRALREVEFRPRHSCDQQLPLPSLLASTIAAPPDVFQALAGAEQPAGSETGSLDAQRGKKRAKPGGSATSATSQDPGPARGSAILRRLAPLKEGNFINALTTPDLEDNMSVEEAAFTAATAAMRALIQATEEALAVAEKEEGYEKATENKMAKHSGPASTAASHRQVPIRPPRRQRHGR